MTQAAPAPDAPPAAPDPPARRRDPAKAGARRAALPSALLGLWQAWRLRHRRRYLLLRANRRHRRELTAVQDHSAQVQPGDVLLFCTFRNEAERLPEFLDHYRGLGIRHFFFVDNASTDGGPALLLGAKDVSLWRATTSYKASRFGMDWLNGLLLRHGHDHWCLTVDADELLIYPHWQTRPLPALTGWLEQQGAASFGAMMLDLYPQGRLDEPQGLPQPVAEDARDAPSQTLPPTAALTAAQTGRARLLWFDAGNYGLRRQDQLWNLWIQGGVRARRFFSQAPERAPTLGKVPLVRWNWRYAYVSSTHTLLPRRLNEVYARDGGEQISGILLHTKFLPSITTRSAEERHRQEHFANSALYDQYYTALTEAPDLWTPASTRLTGWRQLEALGLMSRGGWV